MESPSRNVALPVLSSEASGRREVVRSVGAISAALLAALGLGEVAAKRGQATDERRGQGGGHQRSKRGKRGEAGPGGPAGSPGSPGEKGGQGEKGDKGDQGDQGIQGGKGDTGDKGDKGEKGDTGDKGDPGLQTITLTDGNAISPSGIAETSTATCAVGATAIGGGWTAAIVSNCDVVRNARSQIDARNWEVILVCFNGSATAFKAQAICLS